jgi:hypothetical protein
MPSRQRSDEARQARLVLCSLIGFAVALGGAQHAHELADGLYGLNLLARELDAFHVFEPQRNHVTVERVDAEVTLQLLLHVQLSRMRAQLSRERVAHASISRVVHGVFPFTAACLPHCV